jgi:hypothetical protein
MKIIDKALNDARFVKHKTVSLTSHPRPFFIFESAGNKFPPQFMEASCPKGCFAKTDSSRQPTGGGLTGEAVSKSLPWHRPPGQV